MNRDNVLKVIAELRSTKRTQTRGYLEKNGCNCCLGVACYVAIEAGLPIEVSDFDRPLNPDSEVVDRFVQFDGESGSLPPSVMEWLGTSHNPPLVVPDSIPLAESVPAWSDGRVAATILNDNAKLTFAQIADCFEATLEAERDQ